MKNFLRILTLTAAVAEAACAPGRRGGWRYAAESDPQAGRSIAGLGENAAPSASSEELPLQIVIAAPYRSTPLTSENFADLEADSAAAKDSAQAYAAMLGIEIVRIDANAGVYDGAAELSRTYILKGADRAAADLFASLMADLSAEYQESVIAMDYAGGNAWELAYRLPHGIRIEPVTSDLGDGGGTFSLENASLRIMCFDPGIRDSLRTAFARRPQYEPLGCRSANCRLLGNADRQQIYLEVLAQQNLPVRLLDACSRALAICRRAADK